MKILNKITDDIFVMQLEEQDKRDYTQIHVAHDYVRLTGPRSYYLDTKDGQETIRISAETTIGIYDMIRLVLPYLNSHPYLQEEHLHREDVEGPCYTYQGEEVSMWRPTGRKVERTHTDIWSGQVNKWTEDEYIRHWYVREEFEDEYLDFTSEKDYNNYKSKDWEIRERMRIERIKARQESREKQSQKKLPLEDLEALAELKKKLDEQ